MPTRYLSQHQETCWEIGKVIPHPRLSWWWNKFLPLWNGTIDWDQHWILVCHDTSDGTTGTINQFSHEGFDLLKKFEEPNIHQREARLNGNWMRRNVPLSLPRFTKNHEVIHIILLLLWSSLNYIQKSLG